MAGYLAGSRDGTEGVQRIRATLTAIKNSREARRLAAEAIIAAESVIRRAAGTRDGRGGRPGQRLARGARAGSCPAGRITGRLSPERRPGRPPSRRYGGVRGGRAR